MVFLHQENFYTKQQQYQPSKNDKTNLMAGPEFIGCLSGKSIYTSDPDQFG